MAIQRLVVVGASLAGLRAVEAARKAGFAGTITLIGAESHLPYDRPPLSKRLLAGAQTLGWSTVEVPLAINSTPYDGRAACARCRQCVGFACPVEAKNTSENTVLAKASATGNLSILLATRAERIVTDDAGRVARGCVRRLAERRDRGRCPRVRGGVALTPRSQPTRPAPAQRSYASRCWARHTR